MKKILAALLVLALVAPALAVVNITASDAGNQQLLISFSTSGGPPAPVVRGMALELTVTGGDVTTLPGDVLASDFNTYVDYAFSNPTGYDVGEGHPLAKTGQAGELTVLPSSHFSVSVGHLDQTGSHGGLANGTVIKLQLHNIAAGGSATVAIAVDAIRGGAVVGNDLGTVNVQASQVIAGEAETVSTPTEPTGPTPVVEDTSNDYTTGGSVSNAGHAVEYQFDWGSGPSGVWGSATQSHIFADPGIYSVKAQARCVPDHVVSGWSAGLAVNVTSSETVSTPNTPTVLGTRFFGGNTPAIQVLPVTTGGSTCSIGGHLVQYRFDWGDGVISPWGATGVVKQTKGYATPGYVWTIKAQARCATNNAIVSAWSTPATGTVANECQKFNLTRRINGATDNSLTASDLTVLVNYVNANRSNTAAFGTTISHPNYDYRYNFDTSTTIAAGDMTVIVNYVNAARTNSAAFGRNCVAIPPGE